jgi:hypothetical protein
MCRRKLLPSALRNALQMWHHALLPLVVCDCRWVMRTCLYMKDLVQPGKVHLKGREAVVVVELGSAEVEASVLRRDERCFLEICPVRAASEPNVAVQSFQAQVVVPFGQCVDLRCFLRSVIVAKVAEQVVPQGMSHWQEIRFGGEAP